MPDFISFRIDQNMSEKSCKPQFPVKKTLSADFLGNFRDHSLILPIVLAILEVACIDPFTVYPNISLAALDVGWLFVGIWLKTR
jgi:hypothetical protein